MSMTMARLAVERGARDVFDKFFTSERDGIREDWESYINLDDLDMWSSRDCVIGQMSPVISEPEDKEDANYNTALTALDNKLATRVPDTYEYGLWAERHGFEAGPDYNFQELNTAWVDEIQARLDKLNHG